MSMELKFALNHNETPILTLDDLRKYCDIDQLLKDYRDGKLRGLLEAIKNFESLISAIDNISSENDLELAEELVRILDIDRQILEEYKAKKESWQKCLESGSTYYNLKEYEKAIADYTKVIELNPNVGKDYYDRNRKLVHIILTILMLAIIGAFFTVR